MNGALWASVGEASCGAHHSLAASSGPLLSLSLSLSGGSTQHSGLHVPFLCRVAVDRRHSSFCNCKMGPFVQMQHSSCRVLHREP